MNIAQYFHLIVSTYCYDNMILSQLLVPRSVFSCFVCSISAEGLLSRGLRTYHIDQTRPQCANESLKALITTYINSARNY